MRLSSSFALALTIICLIPLIPINSNDILPIRIALSVDKGSIRDMIFVMKSISEAVIKRESVVIHIVACESTQNEALLLANHITEVIRDCIPEIRSEVLPYSISNSSGFRRQMHKEKKKSHWASSTGADMIRFFIPNLYKQYERILYLDNDIIVTCCIEEIWTVNMGEKVAGLVLDRSDWASSNQFRRHYNATHPIVVQAMRRSPNVTAINNTVTVSEFLTAVPNYPNDGVILFNIKKFNDMKLLDDLEQIAIENSKTYVVGLGSQQFTTLLFHDRWLMLGYRFNLRHFPDVARGFLMYFYYHGFLHYAGSHKPLSL